MIRPLTLGTVLLLMSSAAFANCTVTATGLAFGTYSPLSTSPKNSTGTVTVTCKGGGHQSAIPYSIALNAGANSGNSFSNRRMISGSSYLSYQLYTNPPPANIWGDGTGGTSTVSGACLMNTKPPKCTSSQTIYGQIPARQSPVPGNYTDTITVTVIY